jgi:hypothetical protein
MRETITREEYERFLSLAPTSVLQQAGNCMSAEIDRFPEGSPEAEVIGVMLLMLFMEYQLRQVEPLWRKARRFAIRNSDTFKEVGKVAAFIGIGAILGVSLDN